MKIVKHSSVTTSSCFIRKFTLGSSTAMKQIWWSPEGKPRDIWFLSLGQVEGIYSVPPLSFHRQATNRGAKETGKTVKHQVTSLLRMTAESTNSRTKENNGITHLSSAPYRTMQETHLINEAALYFFLLLISFLFMHLWINWTYFPISSVEAQEHLRAKAVVWCSRETATVLWW